MPEVLEHPGEGAGERSAAAGLDGVEGRDVLEGADRRRVVEAQGDPRCERPSADLHHDAVQGGAGGAQLVGDLPGQRRPALDREAVVGALAGERDGALGEGLLQPEIGGIAGLTGVSRAGDDARVQGPEAVDHRDVGGGRDEHPQLASRGPGDHRGGEGSVAAARDGEGPRGVAVTQRLGHPQLQEDPEQVTRLVRARHVASLVLDPHGSLRREARGPGDRRHPDQRRDPEARCRPRRPRRRRARARGPRSGRRPSRRRGRRGRRGTGRGSG